MRDVKEGRNAETKLADTQCPAFESPVSSRTSQSSFEGVKRNKASHRRHETTDASKEDKTHEKCRKQKIFKSSSSSSMSLYTVSSSSKRDSLLSTSEPKALKASLAASTLPVVKTVEKFYALAADYRTYRLANRSPRYGDTISNYFASFVKKIKSQVKAHFFDHKDPISIMRFLATFKLPCVTNKIHEDVTIWGLPHFVKESIANASNSRMCAEDRTAPFSATVRHDEIRLRKLLRSYSKMVKYLVKKTQPTQQLRNTMP